MVVAGAVNVLLGGVLDGILLALDELRGCATTMEDLREMMVADAVTIRDALVPDAAPAFFFARFEKAVNGTTEASEDASATGSAAASAATTPMDVATPPLPIASPPIASRRSKDEVSASGCIDADYQCLQRRSRRIGVLLCKPL